MSNANQNHISKAFPLVIRSSFCFCKPQLLLSKINHVNYLSQSQLLLAKTKWKSNYKSKGSIEANFWCRKFWGPTQIVAAVHEIAIICLGLSDRSINTSGTADIFWYFNPADEIFWFNILKNIVILSSFRSCLNIYSSRDRNKKNILLLQIQFHWENILQIF